MEKRNCKSKYRRSASDSPESPIPMSPNNRGKATSSLPPPEISLTPDLHRLSASPNVAQRFEISVAPDNIHSPYHLHSSDHPDIPKYPLHQECC
ncbi:unnamed protein product [Cochlearia groenlandica]